jgi:hypothetical protein
VCECLCACRFLFFVPDRIWLRLFLYIDARVLYLFACLLDFLSSKFDKNETLSPPDPASERNKREGKIILEKQNRKKGDMRAYWSELRCILRLAFA